MAHHDEGTILSGRVFPKNHTDLERLVSRGAGKMQRLVVELLDKAGQDGLALIELRGLIFGWRPSERGELLEGRRGRWAPVRRSDRSLRRALGRLMELGDVVSFQWVPEGASSPRTRFRLAGWAPAGPPEKRTDGEAVSRETDTYEPPSDQNEARGAPSLAPTDEASGESGGWWGLRRGARFLDVTEPALRRRLERHSFRADDGITEAQVDGVRGRKWGRHWRVQISGGWRCTSDGR